MIVAEHVEFKPEFNKDRERTPIEQAKAGDISLDDLNDDLAVQFAAEAARTAEYEVAF
jgi:hypothetical protein